MGLLSFVKSSLHKSSEIKKISAILGKQKTTQEIFQDMVINHSNAAEEAKERLFNLCEKDKNLKQVMQKYGANRDHLKDIYSKLMVGGAGQWLKGEFIPVSALLFPRTLEYLMQNYNKLMSSYNDLQRVCFRMIIYFENKEIGSIPADE